MRSALYRFIVAVLTLLTASAPEPPKAPPAPQEAFARIESGRTMAVQNGFSISFFGSDGSLSTMELRSASVIRPGKCCFSNHFVFMPDIGFGIVRRGGRFQPAGCAVFDRGGRAVREFFAVQNAFAENSAANSNYFRAQTVFFIGDNTVAIKTNAGTFLYDIVRNTTVLKKCDEHCFEHRKPDFEHGEAAADAESPVAEDPKPKREHDEHTDSEAECGSFGGRPRIEYGKPQRGCGSLGGVPRGEKE